MAKILDECKLVCTSHGHAQCVLPAGHASYCLCPKCESPLHQKHRPVGEILKTEEAAEIWKKWKPFVVGLILAFLPLFAHAQELNMGVRDVFPRDTWTQGALLLGRPENFEIARTVLVATVPVGVQDFVVESTEGIPDGLLALIYNPADPTGRPIDGFDVVVTGPNTLHTDKINRYQFEPGFTVQIAANADPNGALLQGVGRGGTLRKVIVKGREVLREEIYFDARGKLRGTRWRKIK
jgi:hypothetical protein